MRFQLEHLYLMRAQCRHQGFKLVIMVERQTIRPALETLRDPRHERLGQAIGCDAQFDITSRVAVQEILGRIQRDDMPVLEHRDTPA